MSLTLDDVEKIARLSRLSLSADEKNAALEKLNAVFALVEKMQTVNTDGIEPMAHPHEVSEMEVKGRNLAEGIPRAFTITSNEVLEALADPLSQIVQAVRNALEQCAAAG